MNIGILPLGNHARNRIIPNIPGTDFKVASIYSRSLEKIQKVSEELGASAFDDMDSFFDSGLDAVYISSPNSLHYPHARKALESGKHVLLEKQMTLTVSDAEELTNLAEKYGLTLDIGFHLRFHPAIAEVRKLIEDDGIGDILQVSGRWSGRSSSRAADPSRSWWEDPEMVGGGSVMGTGVHVVDTIKHLCGGLPTGVAGWRSPGSSVIDDSFFLNLFYSDKVASVLSSRKTDVPDNSLRILGSSGYIEVTGFFSTEINSELFLNGEQKQTFGGGNMYHSELKAFRDSINGQKTDIATAKDGVDVVRILNAAVKSIESGTVVDPAKLE